ncbi:MAG TPA: bifunctional riboflavin kinase/FAD synthetase [Bryobacteraceae bacterium]|nr:bifunctional riboflavin kinase/FAD synthetase [Bryobacteraceae bacterium]
MRIYRNPTEVPDGFGPSALTIGNFDGVHVGHRQILRKLRSLASERGWKAVPLTFDPHPTRVVAPARAPRLLSTPARRAQLMAQEGIEDVVILPFTRELAMLSPEEFVRDLLVERFGARAVLVGDNFRFGHRQAGNVEVLAELGRKYGFETIVVPAVTQRGRIVSSSVVRELIAGGKVALAARLLDRPYALQGDVVSGRGVGSKQTVPTLNLATEAEVIPANGVYVTRTRDREGVRVWNSITNIGLRPTFGASEELSIETFLLEPMGGETPRRIQVEFLWRVRDERKFETPEALKQQILRDVRVAQTYFRRAGAWVGRIPCASS